MKRVTPASRVFTARVMRGNQLGRTIGFPTLNLDPSSLPVETKPGVYASQVEIDSQTYGGALYFGPRLVLNETTTVLEIFLLDFSQEIYDQSISFELKKWIRPPLDFATFPEMQDRLKQDVIEVREALTAISPVESGQK